MPESVTERDVRIAIPPGPMLYSGPAWVNPQTLPPDAPAFEIVDVLWSDIREFLGNVDEWVRGREWEVTIRIGGPRWQDLPYPVTYLKRRSLVLDGKLYDVRVIVDPAFRGWELIDTL